MTATKETKHSFETQGTPLTKDVLLREILTHRHRFPHIDTAHLDIHGRLGETGVVVTNGHGAVVASVRHGRFIPVKIDGAHVEFGGRQATNHIERTLERPVDPEETQRTAQNVLYALRNAPTLREVSYGFTGLGAGGSEPEAWAINQDGTPAQIHGGELQVGLVEETLGAVTCPREFMVMRAEQTLARKARYPDAVIIDTSTLPTASPMDMQVSSEGEIGPYVRAIQHRLWDSYMDCVDPVARQLMDKIAQTHSFTDFDDMKSQMGNMAFWVVSASHLSIGMHHRRSGNEAMWVPESEAIAISDIFNSNLATLAEMLMMSTPMVYGMTPTVTVGGQELWPRDMRTIMRHTLNTTFAAPFIVDSDTLHSRITDSIVSGRSHTLDRSSYTADTSAGPMPVMHGRVRNRMASSEPRNQTGRVEFTGCSSSPSMFDETARNCFLQILTMAAYEALGDGKHPAEHFRKLFPNISRWQEQQQYAYEATLFGFNHPHVKALIQEGINLAGYMARKYPAVREQAEIVIKRLANLTMPAVQSLEAYRMNPQGSIAEVLQNELRSGVTPLDLTKRIEQYQLSVARQILQSR
ncbi:MAG: hypothetical protein WC775_06145 [Patescibacteria group bacterium]|jgi:hypothetical protein